MTKIYLFFWDVNTPYKYEMEVRIERSDNSGVGTTIRTNISESQFNHLKNGLPEKTMPGGKYFVIEN